MQCPALGHPFLSLHTTCDPRQTLLPPRPGGPFLRHGGRRRGCQGWLGECPESLISTFFSTPHRPHTKHTPRPLHAPTRPHPSPHTHLELGEHAIQRQAVRRTAGSIIKPPFIYIHPPPKLTLLPLHLNPHRRHRLSALAHNAGRRRRHRRRPEKEEKQPTTQWRPHVGQDHPHAFQLLLEHRLLRRFLAPSPHHHAQALLLALPHRQARLPRPTGALRGSLHGMLMATFYIYLALFVR